VISREQKLRQAFFSLHNIYPFKDTSEQSFGIFRTNALPIEEGGVEGGVFFHTSRINHACINKSSKNWTSNIKRYTVHALRDIPTDDEITIYSLALDMNREDREVSPPKVPF
jgi:hypothetical protein